VASVRQETLVIPRHNSFSRRPTDWLIIWKQHNDLIPMPMIYSCHDQTLTIHCSCETK
jgi:hypothetical protein